MPDVKIPTTIAQLLASAGQSTANIAKHRAAMAQVAAQAAAAIPQPPAQTGEHK
jgi:hypothetical protein